MTGPVQRVTSQIEVVMDLLRRREWAHARVLTGGLLDQGVAAPQLFHLHALTFYLNREYQEARHWLGAAIEGDPGNPTYLFDLAKLLHETGAISEAREHYTRYLALRPDDARALVERAGCDYDLGNLDGARVSLELALRRAGHVALLWGRLGRVRFDMGDITGAMAAFRKALKRDPRLVRSRLNLATLHRLNGDVVAGLKLLERGCREIPDAIESHIALSSYCYDIGHYAKAIAALNAASRLDPDHQDVVMGLVDIDLEQKRFSAAQERLQAYLESHPQFARGVGTMGRILGTTGKPVQAMAYFKRGAELGDNVSTSNYLLNLNYLDGFSADEISRQHRAMGERIEDNAKYPRIDLPAYQPAEKIRVGYFSADLRRHSVASFLEPLLAAHDRDRFEIYCYSNSSVEDEFTRRLRAHATVWRDIEGLSSSAVKSIARDDRLAIAVDLSGHTQGTRLEAFVLKLAPIQVTYLGYPNTTGMKSIDYRFVDAITDPETADHLCTEQLVRLVGGFLCYSPLPNAPEIVFDKHARDAGIVFGSFNNYAKLSDSTLVLWSRILAQTPDSTLNLKAKAFAEDKVQEEVRRRLQLAGISPERVRLDAPVATFEGHLAQYNRIDVALDSVPYNGTTTTYEALWMGVPVVTLVGDRHAARVGASILTHAGHAELIAEDGEAYVTRALEIASDGDYRRRFAGAIRQEMAVAGMLDGRRLAAEIERHYAWMIDRHAGS